MTVQPVEHTPVPGYPDKYAEESRQALAAARPRRWVTVPLAAGLAATVAIGLGGCEFATAGVPAQTPMETETTDYAVMGESLPIAAGTKIPLFEYGNGTGSIGCVSVAAPVFLSEEEAFAILSTAFAEAGVMLRRNSKARQATLPVTIINEYDDKATKTKKGRLKPDALFDEIPLVFVSQEDVISWEYKAVGPIFSSSSVSSYSMKDAAQTLAENNPGLVVFYDPVTYWTEGGESIDWFSCMETEQEARAESQRLLRQQVQAFLQWLAKEGTR